MNCTIIAPSITGSATIITPQGVRTIDEIDSLTEFFRGTGVYPVLEIESLAFPPGLDPRRVGENIIVHGHYQGRSFVIERVDDGYSYGRRKILHLIADGRVVFIHNEHVEEIMVTAGQRIN